MINQFGERIRELREERRLLQRQLAAAMEIDGPLLSKVERGDRIAKREQVILLSQLLKVDEKELLTLWLADKILRTINKENYANEALLLAQKLHS